MIDVVNDTAEIIEPHGVTADLDHVGLFDRVIVIQDCDPMPVDVPFRAELVIDDSVIAVSDIAMRDDHRQTLTFIFHGFGPLSPQHVGIRYIGCVDGKWESVELLKAVSRAQ